MTKTAELNGFTGSLAELVRQVQSGNEVLLTQGNKPVARIVPASGNPAAVATGLQIKSLKGHKVLTPVISQSDLVDDMFDRS